jgi:hypothetical protein
VETVTLPAAIAELITSVDAFEIIRDQVAAILAVETANQQALAVAASLDPYPWALRIFSERTNAWGEFQDLPDDMPRDPVVPVVNVWWHGLNFDQSASNVVERQKGTSTLYVDCYAYATSEDIAAGGHRPGDQLAALEVHRVARLVRRMLMAGTYTYLGLRGVVWRRWIASIDMMEPAMDAYQAQRIGCARLLLQVDHSEYSPQVSGEPLELLSVGVKRAETGELFFTANYPDGAT